MNTKMIGQVNQGHRKKSQNRFSPFAVTQFKMNSF